ncbi:LysM peptidoglycan-binding domain-containing protein [Parageobacillus thermoglucosidasius]|uniref:Peptidoglycan-binding protein n=1 Tax=Parageobacillus thermoglucosidasius TaxID=1426 RepID=A0AAN0YQB2_PARTM|nr:LysM domain-containing protein [Parageobacillus thermoglucosidasius]ALF11352.1 peptidoglycan-binding protein [Parageobacillus thermoglucosidasius]ANZ31430.1 peptidoglycan-binding protein [Parageobacillus thermoglucosidasius]APM82167.1 peptidoglycan-binding protein [Parageobacillus thermoglucosidasius]KJX69102.1 peptidoglycan-binding protein [Parageobacillus thermoglucosidasius]OUM93423.1 MAG: peptidoglycan-binding protein [Parageobacillus thermoglucosidasius]
MSQHEQAEEVWRGSAEQKQEDVLSLPSRREVHKQKKAKKRAKWKLKYPLIRLLVLFFISLPFLIFIYYTNNDSKTVTVVTRSETGSYEQIDIVPAEEKPVAPLSGSNRQKKDRPQSGEQKENGASDKQPQKPKMIMHTVQENETLYSIAIKYYQSDKGMEIIKKWNHLESMQLHKGQVLQIPMVDVEK